ncbi:hypothetical protein AMATHDRAFT_71525 [Amanita thiersii Skay4041]|uniref:Uncharacterized protein n=1 Tax=Amanita thiersii Skay4041 TaxID=703135 RepID=A0A2A9N6F3_9AGAR|nr:hypothetical protein AMATHDRAFT_71525 [Amanita thiersii Skay4041]
MHLKWQLAESENLSKVKRELSLAQNWNEPYEYLLAKVMNNSVTVPMNEPINPQNVGPIQYLQIREEVLAKVFVNAFTSTGQKANKPKVEEFDCPGIRFWRREAWKRFPKDTLSKLSYPNGKVISQKTLFLETRDSKIADPQIFKNIREHLHSRFDSLETIMPSVIMKTWETYDLAVRDVVMRDLCLTFPEFVLCEANWKAHAYIVEWYPSWKRHVVKGEVKEEPKDKGLRCGYSPIHVHQEQV